MIVCIIRGDGMKKISQGIPLGKTNEMNTVQVLKLLMLILLVIDLCVDISNKK